MIFFIGAGLCAFFIAGCLFGDFLDDVERERRDARRRNRSR